MSAPLPPSRTALRALVEIAAGLAALVVIDFAFGNGDRFAGVEPHPFGIVVLLAAAQYGVGAGVAAALAASAALFAGHVPPVHFGEDIYGYIARAGFQPALWLGAGAIVGLIADRHRGRAARAAREAQDAYLDMQRLRLQAEHLSETNEALERRLAAELRTVVRLYQASRAIERRGTGDVLAGVAKLVPEVLGARTFSLFLRNGRRFEAVLAEGWCAGERYKRVLDERHPLVRAAAGARRVLCAARPNDERALAGEGVLAGPVMANGEIMGILKIERMQFLDLTLAAVQNFHIICEWIGEAYARAIAFERAAREKVIESDAPVLAAHVVDRVAQLLSAMGRRSSFAVIRLDVTFPDAAAGVAARMLAECVDKDLRDTDLAFEMGRGGAGFAVLAPAAAAKNTGEIAGRLTASLHRKLLAHGIGEAPQVEARVLYDPESDALSGRHEKEAA